MIFNVDGEQIRLSGDGSRSNRDVFSGGTVIETAFYMTTYDKIERIVAGQMVYVKIVGSNQHATHIIPATVKSNIRRFLREHPPINADSLSIERKGAQPARRTHRPKKGSI
jgi:hypothetical protein